MVEWGWVFSEERLTKKERIDFFCWPVALIFA
jgi:hypothetical protein